MFLFLPFCSFFNTLNTLCNNAMTVYKERVKNTQVFSLELGLFKPSSKLAALIDGPKHKHDIIVTSVTLGNERGGHLFTPLILP